MTPPFWCSPGQTRPRSSLDSYRTMLARAAQAGVPAICVNPDIAMIRDGQLVPAPGAIARIYEDLGGPSNMSASLSCDLPPRAHRCRRRGSPRVMVGDSPSMTCPAPGRRGCRRCSSEPGYTNRSSEPELLRCAPIVAAHRISWRRRSGGRRSGTRIKSSALCR